MVSWCDGPQSPLFETLKLRGGMSWQGTGQRNLPEIILANLEHAPRGACVSWGIPFMVGARIAMARGARPVTLNFDPVKAPWFVFMHTADQPVLPQREDGLFSPAKGWGALADPVADYVFCYADGSEHRHTVRRRYEINMFQRPWGESSFGCVSHRKPAPICPLTQHHYQSYDWGQSQTRASYNDLLPWTNWIWAWKIHSPKKP